MRTSQGVLSHRDRLTNIPLLKPSQCGLILPLRVLAEHEQVAIANNGSGRPPEIDRNDDESNQPQDKNHEGADHDNAGQQSTLANEPDYETNIQYRDRPDCDEVWKIPRHRKVQLLLYLDEGTENTDDERRRQQHNEHP